MAPSGRGDHHTIGTCKETRLCVFYLKLLRLAETLRVTVEIGAITSDYMHVSLEIVAIGSDYVRSS